MRTSLNTAVIYGSARRCRHGIKAADGFIIVSAEYNHSIPAALKNLLDHFQSEYLYKPSAIVTYSVGPFGGVRGLINLRAILAELGTPSIPSAFSISQIINSFDEDGHLLDQAYAERIAGRQYRTILAQKTMSNYFNHIAATPLDDKFSAMAWEPNSQYKHPAFIPVPMLQSGNDSIFRIHLTTRELHP